MAYVTSRDTLVIKIHYAGARRHWDASHYFASFGRLKIWRLKQRPHYTVVMLNNLLGLAHSPTLIHNACDLQPAGMPSGLWRCETFEIADVCARLWTLTLRTLSTSGTNFRRPFPVVTSAHCGSNPCQCVHLHPVTISRLVPPQSTTCLLSADVSTFWEYSFQVRASTA